MNCFENRLCSFLFYSVLLYPVCPPIPQTLQVKINRPGDGSSPLSTWLDLDRSKGMSLRQFSQKSLTEEKRFILSEKIPPAGLGSQTGHRGRRQVKHCVYISLLPEAGAARAHRVHAKPSPSLWTVSPQTGSPGKPSSLWCFYQAFCHSKREVTNRGL